MPFKDPKKRAENHKRYMKTWYAKNKAKHQAMVHKRHLRLGELVRSLRKECEKCGETHPACLDFHHRNPEEKELDLAEAAIRGWSEKRILAEIEKCSTLCSNCHRKEHWESKLSR